MVGGVREVLAPLAAAFFDHPSRRFDLVGVTGTNGKTTTTFMLEAIFRAAGLVPGVLGTVEVRVGDARRPAVHTTPEAPDLQRLLAEMADAGVQAAAMEVSSHGLALHRVDGTRFKAAVFTNLTQDHLDFHTDLDDYYRAKRRLFTPEFTPWGGQRRRPPRAPARRDGRGGHRHHRHRRRRRLAGHRRRRLAGGDQLPGPLAGGSRTVRLRLAGFFNVANALGALAAADAVGIDLGTAVAGLEALDGVPGRFERVDAGQPFTVLVDYAHTPDSLDNLLRAARAVTGGRVIVVFGCGGDRDRAKRPLMGEIAGRLADVAVVTSDNPRSEDPEAIVDQVAEGVARGAGPGGFLVEVDRRAAIRAALAMAGPGDAVLVAGKGHEQGQEFAGGRKVPFDDRVVAAEERARCWEPPGDPLKEVAEVTGGRLAGADPDAVVTGVQVDSRQVAAGELFVALPGSRTDGSLFAAAAAEAGAAATLAQEGTVFAGPRVEVADPLAALAALGTAVRDRSAATVVAVTGSNGKTTTKDLLAAVLATRLETVANQASFNNEVGLPLTLARIEPGTQAVVVEMGARGHIAALARLARPAVGVVLNVGESHLGMFGSREAIAKAKGELVEALLPDGTAVLNADDPQVAAMADRTMARVVTSARSAGEVRAEGSRLDGDGRARFLLHTPAGTAPVVLPAPGEHLVGCALAAAAAATSSGSGRPTPPPAWPRPASRPCGCRSTAGPTA